VQARLELAQFFLETGKADQARPVLERLVAEQPNNLMALEGISRLQSAGKDDAAALRTAMMIQSLQPNSPSGYLLAGQVQQAQKDSAAARRSYEQAMAIDPGAVAPVMALTRLDRDGRAARTRARPAWTND